MPQTNFHIINASAGSGKTYTLVLAYLKKILADHNQRAFRHVLALTFTNKAVNEMKERIVEALLSLSHYKAPSDMVKKLKDELTITEEELALRADQRLRVILMEYGSFDVITLDKFTHRLIRTFAREFQWSSNFEVALDSKTLLEETVLSIIEEVGVDPVLSKTLLAFSLEKVRNGKDWDVQQDLDEFAALLLNENDRKQISDLKDKDFDEFYEDKQLLFEEKNKIQKEAIQSAETALRFLKDQGLNEEDFKSQLVHKHFYKVQQCIFEKLYENQLEAALNGDKPLYNKSLSEDKKKHIDGIQEQLRSHFYHIKKQVGKYQVLERTHKAWIPRMLLQLIEQRLEQLQEEKDTRLLGEFNKKISQLVRDEPAPFIYERLGTRYQHYFLDEFQDTSKVQWANLTPLIANALESESLEGGKGSLLLVGDPKQAIYGWRGGDMDQFIHLTNQSKNPFQVGAHTASLGTNYRSGGEIVTFNNGFFSFLSHQFKRDDYKNIYGKGSQQTPNNQGGYVCLEAIPKGTKEETTPHYVSKTLAAVEKLIAVGYATSELAILVRKKEQAGAIGMALISQDFEVISSESLQVSKSKKVQVLISFLTLSINPDKSELHKLLFDGLWEIQKRDFKEYHSFAVAFLNAKTTDFLTQLQKVFDFKIEFESLQSMPVSEAVDYLLMCLSFLDSKDAYIQAFLEDVFEFSKTSNTSIFSYLKHWEQQEEKLRIATPEASEAIKLMTIHQAKGLEFKAVILPFMDTPIQPVKTYKIWYPFKDEPLKKLRWGWFNFSKELKHFGTLGAELYESSRLAHQLDAFNVLYVALTRASEVLHIITQEAEVGSDSYAQFFSSYAEVLNHKLTVDLPFEKGDFPKKHKKTKEKVLETVESIVPTLGVTTFWKERLVPEIQKNSSSSDAQKQGNLTHELLAKVIRSEEVSEVIENAIRDEILTEKDKEILQEKLWKVVDHPQLNSFFNGEDRVLCEQDLLVPKGPTLRPDRINFSNSGTVSILDYKTGKPKEEDKKQILTYAEVLKTMGYKSIHQYLVYLNPDILVVKMN